jgi:hypothetical protein
MGYCHHRIASSPGILAEGLISPRRKMNIRWPLNLRFRRGEGDDDASPRTRSVPFIIGARRHHHHAALLAIFWLNPRHIEVANENAAAFGHEVNRQNSISPCFYDAIMSCNAWTLQGLSSVTDDVSCVVSYWRQSEPTDPREAARSDDKLREAGERSLTPSQAAMDCFVPLRSARGPRNDGLTPAAAAVASAVAPGTAPAGARPFSRSTACRA